MPISVSDVWTRTLATGLMFAGMGLSTATQAEDLLEVYNLALDNDASYQAAQFQYSAATEARPQARAGLLPEIAFEAERIRTEQDIRSSDNVFYGTGKTHFPTTNLTLSLTQPVFRYSSWVGFKQAKLAVKQAETELSVAQQQLIVDVAQAYFAVLTAQDNLEYAQVEKTAVGRQLELARSRTKTGIGRMTDLYDAEARFALSESREIEAQNALDDSFQALREHTDKAIAHLTPVRDDMQLVAPDPADPSQWIKKALEQNLALEVRQQSLDVAVKEVERQKAGHYPTLDLVATRNRRDTNGSLLGGGSNIETTDILLRFNLPLYSGGSVQSKMREAADMREKSRREMVAERRKVERETRSAYLGVLSGIKKVEALNQSIVSQQSALEVKTAGLKAGVNTLLEVLDAQRDLYFAQSDYSKARYDYLLSTLKLKQATGSLSMADLEEVNRLIK